MKYCLLFLMIISSFFSCKKEIQHAPIPNKAIDSVTIIKNSILIKSGIDTLIKLNKTVGEIACGTKFTHEVEHDSSNSKIKKTLYYFPTNFISDTTFSSSETTITSYFADQKIVFVNIKYSTDLWETHKFEQNIYVNDSIQIEENLIGKFGELPTDVQEVIKNTLCQWL